MPNPFLRGLRDMGRTIGGGAGRALGGGLGKVGEFAFGSDPKQLQFQQFTPEQQQALSQLLQMGLGGLQQQPFDFGPIREAAQQRFYKDTVPTLAEKFASLGGESGIGTSGFQGALGEAGAGLEKDLAGMEAQFGQQRAQQLLQLLGLGLQPQFQSALMPGQSGAVPELIRSLPFLGGLRGLGR